MPSSDTYLIKIQLQIQNDKALKALTTQLGAAAKQAPKTQAAMKSATVNTKQFGRVAQNAGYQIQDFIVQVQGGTSAVRAFGQQAPQLLVGFGAVGAAIGVVLALMPALFTAFKDTEKESVDLNKAISSLGETMNTFTTDNWIKQFNAATEAQRTFMTQLLKDNLTIARLAQEQQSRAATGPISTLSGIGLGAGREALGLDIPTFAKNVQLFQEFAKTGGTNVELLQEMRQVFIDAREAQGGLTEQGEAYLKRLFDLETALEATATAQKLLNDATAAGGTGQIPTADTGRSEEITGTLSLIEVAAKRVPSAMAVLNVANNDWEQMEQERLQAQYDLEIAYGETATAAEDSAVIQSEAFALFDQSFQTMLNGVLMGTQTLEEGFKSMVKVIIAEMLKLAAYGFIAKAFAGTAFGDAAEGLLSAKGNAFNNGNVIPFANGGIVNGPTVFPMAKGVGLMGEAGPEAVMPLTRLPNGNLGVESAGMNVTINNLAPGVDVRTSQGDDGLTIDVVMATIANAVQRGGNNVADAMEQSYSLNRGRAVY